MGKQRESVCLQYRDKTRNRRYSCVARRTRSFVSAQSQHANRRLSPPSRRRYQCCDAIAVPRLDTAKSTLCAESGYPAHYAMCQKEISFDRIVGA